MSWCLLSLFVLSLCVTFCPLRPGNTGNIFLQLARNNVALQVEKRCCTYYHPPQTLSRNKISLLQVEAACCSKLNWRLLFSTIFFQLATTEFCCVTMFEVGGNTCNDVALQVEEKRCPYYRAFTVIYLSVCKYVIKRCPNKVVTQLTTNMAADGFHFSGLHTTVSSTQSLSNTPKHC